MIHSTITRAFRMQDQFREWVKNFTRATGKNVWYQAVLTIFVAVIIGILVLNPLWARLAPSNMFRPSIWPPITAPVDGIFYLRNADPGYGWSTRDPVSLWFHPLLSNLLDVLPKWLPGNIWFWFLGIVFATACIPFIHQLAAVLGTPSSIPARLLPWCLLAPGGLEMATGNAEIPALFFGLVLLLSILSWQNWWLTGASAAAAILTKPNALYLVPILLVYFVSGWSKQDVKLWKHALLGISTLLCTWLIWTWIVDWQTGYPGAYWEARESFRPYIAAGDALGFFEQWVSSFVERGDLRNQIRYTSAMIIPVVNFIILGVLSFSSAHHRYAMAAGNLAMLAITLYLGNPNKILVYTTTLPAHFVTHILFVMWLLNKHGSQSRLLRAVAGILYLVYCGGMLLVYAFGTPLRWYH